LKMTFGSGQKASCWSCLMDNRKRIELAISVLLPWQIDFRLRSHPSVNWPLMTVAATRWRTH